MLREESVLIFGLLIIDELQNIITLEAEYIVLFCPFLWFIRAGSLHSLKFH